MWAELMKVPNRMTAEMWKDFLEGEGIPAQIWPEPLEAGPAAMVPYRVMVAKAKMPVAWEAIRKL